VKRQEYRIEGLAEPLSHYTDVVRYGDLIFLSGVGPLGEDGGVVGVTTDPDGNLGGLDLELQTRQVFENLKLMLAEVGAGIEDILKVTVYVADINDRKAINQVRKEYFGDVRPTSTLIEISRFCVDGTLLEIEAVAGLPERTT
jgi:2-iminobutanoate/2-iminopropanoate deaminase